MTLLDVMERHGYTLERLAGVDRPGGVRDPRGACSEIAYHSDPALVCHEGARTLQVVKMTTWNPGELLRRTSPMFSYG
jgi:hypothetical protein